MMLELTIYDIISPQKKSPTFRNVSKIIIYGYSIMDTLLNTLSTQIKTENVEVTKSYIVNRFEYKVLNLSFNESVELHITLFSDDTFIKSSMLLINGDLYKQWGDSDEYIIEIIKRNVRKMAIQEKGLVIAE